MTTQMTANEPKQATQDIGQRMTVAPPVDIFENKDEYLVLVDLPGVADGQLDVNLGKGELTIVGRRVTDSRAEQAAEFEYRRSFRIPDVIASDQVSARLNNGVLTLNLPKSERIKPRQITVHSE